MRILRGRHLVETEPHEQTNRANVVRIDRREERADTQFAFEEWQRSPARFERHAATPIFWREGKREISRELRIDRRLHEASAPARVEPHDPIEPPLTPVF